MQAARAREEMAAKVQAKLDLIAPSVGPVFSLPADFEDLKVGSEREFMDWLLSEHVQDQNTYSAHHPEKYMLWIRARPVTGITGRAIQACATGHLAGSSQQCKLFYR